MTKFRGCIDIHSGQVKQIVGGTLSDSTPSQLHTNFVSSHSSAYYSDLYRDNQIEGTHVIKLGPGCDEAAELALQHWKNGLQIGGGITTDNAAEWIAKGASKVIVTSFLFPEAKFSQERLDSLVAKVGKDRLVIDLSCRKRGAEWIVAMNRWQTLTDMKVDKATLDRLSQYCSEFLVHAADVEGLCQGIDEDLVRALGQWVTIPTVYAGGAKNIHDLTIVDRLSEGKVDLTYGSALDIFGGNGVTFEECVAWNRR